MLTSVCVCVCVCVFWCVDFAQWPYGDLEAIDCVKVPRTNKLHYYFAIPPTGSLLSSRQFEHQDQEKTFRAKDDNLLVDGVDFGNVCIGHSPLLPRVAAWRAVAGVSGPHRHPSGTDCVCGAWPTMLVAPSLINTR